MRIHISLAYCMLGTVVPFCHGFVQTNKGVFGRNSHQPSSTLGRSTTDSSGALKSSHYSIDVSDTGPAGGPVHTLTINSLPGDHLAERNEPIVLQTGKLGRQAAGAVTLTRGDTVLYATAARDELPKEGLDFLPLSVEHQERFSSVGMTSGGYNKRDGRPAEHEVLTCRLIDRPLRPLIAKGWRHETQLLSWVMSYDGERSCDPLAITASATAMYLSDIPLSKPVAAAMVGYDAENDKLLLNPTNEEMKKSTLKLIVAGTKDAVLMIEGAADFLPEAIMIRAVNFGHEALKAICVAVEELGDTLKIVKKMDTLVLPPEGLQERINELMTEKVIKTFEGGGTKITQGPKLKALKKEVTEILKEQDGEEFAYTSNDIADCFTDLLIRQIYERAKATGKRCDNREFTQIRHLDMEAGFLPRTHGSAIFTRGETQVVATVTLGDSGMRQKIDQIDGTLVKRFYLQYTFPPSCVGETGRTGAPGRREVGHGNLAERALIPGLPSEKEFPYTIRLESLVTESHGSSSMASVCGGSLALMDAGVPMKNQIAGIAMGMLLGDKKSVSDENAIIVSDILGTEDALGTMDFKIAGDREGITTFQLDIKCEGLSLQTMERALEQARVGRLHILDAMDAAMQGPRGVLPDTVPKLATFSVLPETIGKIIGPGGKQIRAIIEDFGLTNMNVDDEGTVQISSYDAEKLAEAEEFVKVLVTAGPKGGRGGKKDDRPPYVGPEPVEGETYKGKIVGIHPFGVFLEFLPGAEDGSTPPLEGLCHVSELAMERIRNCEGFMKSMNVEELEIIYVGKNDAGKRQLSRKAFLEKRSGRRPPPQAAPSTAADPPAVMSEDEIDVIAKAIEGLSD